MTCHSRRLLRPGVEWVRPAKSSRSLNAVDARKPPVQVPGLALGMSGTDRAAPPALSGRSILRRSTRRAKARSPRSSMRYRPCFAACRCWSQCFPLQYPFGGMISEFPCSAGDRVDTLRREFLQGRVIPLRAEAVINGSGHHRKYAIFMRHMHMLRKLGARREPIAHHDRTLGRIWISHQDCPVCQAKRLPSHTLRHQHAGLLPRTAASVCGCEGRDLNDSLADSGKLEPATRGHRQEAPRRQYLLPVGIILLLSVHRHRSRDNRKDLVLALGSDVRVGVSGKLDPNNRRAPHIRWIADEPGDLVIASRRPTHVIGGEHHTAQFFCRRGRSDESGARKDNHIRTAKALTCHRRAKATLHDAMIVAIGRDRHAPAGSLSRQGRKEADSGCADSLSAPCRMGVGRHRRIWTGMRRVGCNRRKAE
jgi:hypothetical protein